MNGIFPDINKSGAALMLKKPRGFTMIELLVVMAIMVILAGMVFALIGPVREKNAIASTEMLLARINSGIEKYYDDYGYYPECNIKNLNYTALDKTEPGWRYKVEDEAGEALNSIQIPNRYLYQESSFVLWKALVYDPKQRGDEPYVEYPSIHIDKETLKYYNEVDSFEDEYPYEHQCKIAAMKNPSLRWDNGGKEDHFQFGFLDYWGEPIIYLWWKDNERPEFTPKAVPGYEESYELWSLGPDKLFGDFFAGGEDDRDADNIAGVRLPTVQEREDRYDP